MFVDFACKKLRCIDRTTGTVHELITDSITADAILDRMLHKAHGTELVSIFKHQNMMVTRGWKLLSL
jgi:hypothetical protein